VPLVIRLLDDLDAEYSNINLIGEAATGREAIKAESDRQPERDHHGPCDAGHDGFSATAEISRVARDVAVLILTTTSP
jgi:DNA-binding NarL/FixJ family response regulator